MTRTEGAAATAILLAGFAVIRDAGAQEARSPAPAAQPETLTVLNWSWYIEVDDDADPELPITERSPVLAQFAREHGCSLRYIEMDDEAAMREYVLANPGGVDVAVFSTGISADLAGRGVLMPLDASRLPHRAGLLPEVVDELREAGPFAAPYFVGYTGVLYRTDLIDGGLRSWRQFFEPAPGHRVALLNAHDSAFGICSLLLGDPPNTTDLDQIKNAGRLLHALKQSGAIAYLGDDLDRIAGMLREGEISMALMYSGDGLGYEDEDESGRLRFGIPGEGTDFYIDSWVVPAACEHPELAHAFIDFMTRPDVQVRQALYLRVQVVTEEALDLLRRDHSDHPHLRYLAPDAEMRAKTFHIHRPNGEQLTELWNRIMTSS